MHSPLRELLESYLSGALLPAERREWEGHAAACPQCREEVRALEGMAREVRLLRPPEGLDPEPAPGFFARVMYRIEEQQELPFWTMLIDPAFGRRLVFACLVVLALLGGYVASVSPTEPQRLPGAMLAARPAPLLRAPQLGPNLNRNRVAVLATLASDAE